MKTLFLIIAATLTLTAADATGTWIGSLNVPSPDGERSMPARLVLKQQGAALTGTAGPQDGDQEDINNGSVSETGAITSEITHGDRTMKFTLMHQGEEIKGTVTRVNNGQKEEAKLVVKREPSPAK